MRIEEAFNKIESNEFIARCGIASQFDTLIYIASAYLEYEFLKTSLCENEILERIKKLLLEDNNINYTYGDNFVFTHKYDIPIAIYLYILISTNKKDIKNWISYLKNINNFWWTKHLINNYENLSFNNKAN